MRWGLPVLVLFFAFTGQGLRSLSANTASHVSYWPIDDPKYTTLKQPDVGKNRLVFSALVDDHYAVYSSETGRWTPVHTRNFYNPALASDDSTLLVETMANGRTEIWISKGQGKEPIFLQIGQSPTWQVDGRRFAFFRDGFISLYDMQQHQWSSLTEVGNGYDLAFSPDGNQIAYCTWDTRGTSLHVLDIRDGRTWTVLQSLDRIETPTWSPDASRLLFSWNRAGNRDIWTMGLTDQAPVQLTFHQDSDMDPVWFGEQIIFVTDRGHGLEMSTLYRLLLPEERP
jgi:WD40 repeat protein